MLFTLEALEARHGDSLLLHYGTTARPQLIVIDGGPAGVWTRRLRPRLAALRASRADGGALPIVAVAISHIDDDHVNGVLQMFAAIEKRKDSGDEPELDVLGLWHNSFDDLAPKVESQVVRTAETTLRPVMLGGGVPPALKLERPSAIVLASVSQGRELRNAARRLGVPVNFDGKGSLIEAPARGGRTERIGNGLGVTVLGPLAPQLDALRNDWAKQVARLRKAGKLTPASIQVALAAYVDESVYNLSSLVLLAKAGGRSMLLTGDARGDYILEGVEKAGLFKAGRLHVDILKVPHHGSSRDIEPAFFEQITADHYVISADGKYDNPDIDTLKALFAARPKDAYALHLTNRIPTIVRFLAGQRPRRVKVVTRAERDPSLVVDLGDPLRD
jgi:beta-lactamase superfamily II metal-dependent hydrolase